MPDSTISFGTFQSVDMRVAEVVSAGMAEGTRVPSRLVKLDLGPLGLKIAIGQYALMKESDLIGKKVIVCCNMGPKRMGPYESEVLLMGTRHPDSPEKQSQAVPLLAHSLARNGDRVY